MNMYDQSSAEPYSELAQYYDIVMAHVNYKKWAKYILKILYRYDVTEGKVIDLSIGTGCFASHFNSKKYRLIGSDISILMLKQLRLKQLEYISGLVVNDIERIAFKNETADVLLFLYDSANYLTTKIRLHKAFKEIRRVLKPDGLFIFDVVTQRLCEDYFSGTREVLNVGDTEIERKSVYDAQKSFQYNYFVFKKGNKFIREKHIQRIYSMDELMAEINKHDFNIIAALNGLGFKYASEKSERIHFVCKKND